MKHATIAIAVMFCTTFVIGKSLSNAAGTTVHHTAQDTAVQFQLSIGYHENKTIRYTNVSASGDNTVAELKDKAIAGAGVTCGTSNIVYKKKRLEDAKKLREAGIQAGDTCYLACIK